MSERNLKILTPSGTMETFVVRPSDDLTPLVIIYMDIWGVREELREIARQVAALGYSCALPDFFYRQGHIRHEFRDENGRMLTLAKLSEAQKERVRAPLRNLSDAMVMMDTEALLQYLIAKGEIASGPIAAVGYCMGGRHALVAAGMFPQRSEERRVGKECRL